MNKLLIALPIAAIALAGCKSGIYELETPDKKDIAVSIWQGSDTLNDVVKLPNGETMEVQFVTHKERPRDWFADKTGNSGFHVEDLEGNMLVNFTCTKKRSGNLSPFTVKCVRFEVDQSVIPEIPVGTEFRK